MEPDLKLKKLEQLIKLVEDGVSASEFQEFVSTVLDFLKKVGATSQAAAAQLQASFQQHTADITARFQRLEDELKAQVDTVFVGKQIDAMKSEHDQRMAAVDAKIANVRDGKNGRDGKDGKDGRPGRDGRDAVMTPALRQEIDELKEENAKLKERLNRAASSGGGVTNMRIIQAFKYILKTEQPSGLIDGSNTTYTVTQPIFAVLAMSLNGETIAQLPNYTINGKTITFSSPLPAAYSGKDFEIKFI